MRPKKAPLPASLPEADEAQVNGLFKKRGLISKYAQEQVSDHDIAKLKPRTWLNDELINFYGAMILGRSEGSKENPATVNGVHSAGKPLNVHYFSSFFWTKLTTLGYEKARLFRWTKKTDIFAKDMVLIPVNHNNSHWTAGAINFRKKRIESYDSMNMATSLVCKVSDVILDLLVERYLITMVQQLRAYVELEHQNKKNKPFDWTGWEDYTLKVCISSIAKEYTVLPRLAGNSTAGEQL